MALWSCCAAIGSLLVTVGCGGSDADGLFASGGASGNGGTGAEAGSGAVAGTAGSAGQGGDAGVAADAGSGGSITTGGTSSGGSASSGGSGGSPGAGSSGSAGCAPRLFFVDADGDGFGDPASSTLACEAPQGHVEDDSDCYDGNPAARPGQTKWFASDRGDGSFDYDCDGMGTKRFPQVGACTLAICGVQAEGWKDVAPTCGSQHGWVVRCVGVGICVPDTEVRTQDCR